MDSSSKGIRSTKSSLIRVKAVYGRYGKIVCVFDYAQYACMLCYFYLVDILIYQISYYLDESSGWDITIEELQRALDSAREHCQPRALVAVNPSNPTGRYTGHSR